MEQIASQQEIDLQGTDLTQIKRLFAQIIKGSHFKELFSGNRAEVDPDRAERLYINEDNE